MNPMKNYTYSKAGILIALLSLGTLCACVQTRKELGVRPSFCPDIEAPNCTGGDVRRRCNECSPCNKCTWSGSFRGCCICYTCTTVVPLIVVVGLFVLFFKEFISPADHPSIGVNRGLNATLIPGFPGSNGTQ